MAQYYNIVTNPNNTLTIEDVQRMCAVEGQSVQFVVEDMNTGANGTQQYVTYTAATQSSEQTIFPPQAISLSGQIATTQLERQNYYIIKRNEVPQAQDIIKTNTISTQVVGEHVVNIVDATGSPKVSLINTTHGQNTQWVKMEENNIHFDGVVKQNTLIPTAKITPAKIQPANNIPPQLSLHTQGQRCISDQQSFNPTEKKPRLYQNKNRLSAGNVQAVASFNCIQTQNSPSTQADRILTPALISTRSPSVTFRSKTLGPAAPELVRTPARQIRNPNRADASMVKNLVPLVPLNIPKQPSAPQTTEMEYLSEKIKEAAQLKKQQTQKNQLATPSQFQRQVHLQSQQRSSQVVTPQQRQVMPVTPLQQRQVMPVTPLQQRHQMPVTPQQQRQQVLDSPVQRQTMIANTGQQKQQQMALTPQQQAQVRRQPMMMTSQQRQHQMTIAIQGQPQPMEIELPDSSQDIEKLSQQSCGSQTDSESGATASYAYLQEEIDSPHTTIVQRQIRGNETKMLVILPNGEQRLITFDIPNEECTVQDLLEQANICFVGKPKVSLVSDPALGINYIVECGEGSYMCLQDDSEQSESNLSHEKLIPSSDSPPSPIYNASDENSNSSIIQNEEPKYIEGQLALCPYCGYSSFDFNHCERCMRKLQEDVKAIPMVMAPQTQKDKMLAVDKFYKENNESNATSKMEKPERDGSTCKRGKSRGRAAKAKPVKEPECLTISSDEEEEDEKTSRRSDHDNSNMSSTPGSTTRNEDMDTILEKEPVITNNSISNNIECSAETGECIKGGGRETAVQNTTDGSIQAPHTSVSCRTVRIGSYKYVPKERVVVSQSGVKLSVPLLEDSGNYVTLDIKYNDIVKVLIHFGKSMPVLFFYTNVHNGAMIRELLGMQDPKGPYYDPAGKDQTHRRITLLPEKLSEDSKKVLKDLFLPNGLFEELTIKEANDILVLASPKESLQLQNLARKQGQAVSSNSNTNGGIQTIMVYPPPPAKGGIAINTEDYACLGEDQFLNDVIIDFYLKYLTLEVLSEEDQKRTHVFSSYFYKRLTSPHTPTAESAMPLSAAGKRHARVQKWTKNVNIFQKDFIVIPINEHAHWFLAIICFPGLVGKVSVDKPAVKGSDIKKTVQKNKKLKELKLQAVTIGSTTITPVATTITIDPGDDGSERDEAEGDDEEMEMESDDDDETEDQEETVQKQTKPSQPVSNQKDIVKIPCILIFDSLAGASRSRVVATLRDYLSCEYLAKMGTERTFSKDTIKGACPKVPQQSNFTDCGVYVLQYVESFFKNPLKDFTTPIRILKNWFEEIIVTRKREELSKLLIKLMNATKGDKNVSLPVLTFPTQDGKLLPRPENQLELKPVKSELEGKKKSSAEVENRVNTAPPSSEENSEPTSELVNRTSYQLIPYSPGSSSSSTEGSQTDMFAESKTVTRSTRETMSYLKARRIIPRQNQRTSESLDDKQAAKKHKGDDSCK